MADKPTIQMKKRTNRFILIGMMAFAGAIIAQLFKLSIVDNSFYQEKANEYHFGEISISANRGSIYDANGVILAQSATVYKIFMDPDLFRSELEKKKEEILQNMLRTIVHRGPDSEGKYLDEDIALGFRRLSIVDLSEHGNQPMFNENRSLVLVYNGEIYNYRELMPELIAANFSVTVPWQEPKHIRKHRL